MNFTLVVNKKPVEGGFKVSEKGLLSKDSKTVDKAITRLRVQLSEAFKGEGEFRSVEVDHVNKVVSLETWKRNPSPWSLAGRVL